MDSLVTLESAVPSGKPAATQRTTLFTAETARKAAELSRIAAKANRERRAAEVAAMMNPPEAEPQAASFQSVRLSRVCAQLDKIDRMIAEEDDAQKIDRLASAQTRLSEQWRILSGIPLPGSRRPGRETPARKTGDVGPVE